MQYYNPKYDVDYVPAFAVYGVFGPCPQFPDAICILEVIYKDNTGVEIHIDASQDEITEVVVSVVYWMRTNLDLVN